MISARTREKWIMKLRTIQEAVEYNSMQLNDWEIMFIDSIDRLLSEGKDISMQQSITLNRIYGRVGSYRTV